MDIYRVGESKYLKVSWDEVEELVENLAGKIVNSYVLTLHLLNLFLLATRISSRCLLSNDILME